MQPTRSRPRFHSSKRLPAPSEPCTTSRNSPVPSVVRELLSTMTKYPTLQEISRLPSARHFSVEHLELAEPTQPASPSAVETKLSESSVLIEISPGVLKPLRGSKETEDAWQNGLCEHVSCNVCDTKLACVWDCEYVLCPDCRSVAPVSGSGLTVSDSQSSSQNSMCSFEDSGESMTGVSVQREGVGLGIRL
jgi:hypothetical protein